MRLCWDEIEKLRYNKDKGKWYKDRYIDDKCVGTNTYLLNESGCIVCGEHFFYSEGNKGTCCSLSCNTKYRNSIYTMKEETKRNISKARKGSKRSEESKAKQSKSRKGRYMGPDNSNWKGGRRSKKKILYDSMEYKEWRKSVLRGMIILVNYVGIEDTDYNHII